MHLPTRDFCTTPHASRFTLHAVLFVSGAWLLQQQPALPSLLWAYLLAACVLVRWLARDALHRFTWIVDPALWIAAGFVWAGVVAQAKISDQLAVEWEGQDVRVEGTVAQMPVAFERGVRFRFDVDRVLTPLARIPSSLQLAWYAEARTPPPELHAGERWRLSVRLKRPHGAANPHGFDYEFWMLERGIRASGYVRPKATHERVGTGNPRYLVEIVREHVRDRIEGALADEVSGGVLAALAVGEQRAIGAEQWRLFTRTGVNHLMSISGLHITMLSGLAALVVGWCWRRSAKLVLRFPAQKAALVTGLAVAVLYAAVAGFAVPAQRTVLMLAAIVLALLWSRTWSSSFVLAVSLFVVTVFDPFAVMAPGFWLSFGAVALIAYASAHRVGAPSRVMRWVGAQWALTVGLIPLLLVLFAQVSIVSPLANAFAIPLVSLVVVPLTLVGALLPVDFVLLAAGRVMSLCIELLQWLDATPIAAWQQASPSIWSVAVALLGALWLLAPRGFPARWMGMMAMLPMFLTVAPAPGQGEAWLDVLDVGQGLGVVVRTARHQLLFDTGPGYSEESDAGDRVVVPYLRAQGISNLSGLIVSHDDSDHSGGAASVLRMVTVDWMASSLAPEHALHALAARSVRCVSGQRWKWDGVDFEMLHPSAGSYEDTHIKDNNRSCVLRVSVPGASALIPADIEAAAEARLLRETPQLPRTDILIAPHHGSGTSSTETFLRQVVPRFAVFTNGYRNSFGHPKEEVVQRYRDLGAKLYRSDQHGAILFRMKENVIEASAWREQQRRYWRGR